MQISVNVKYCMKQDASAASCPTNEAASPLNRNPVRLRIVVTKGMEREPGLRFEHFSVSSPQPPQGSFFKICNSEECRTIFQESSRNGKYILFLVPDADAEEEGLKWEYGEYKPNHLHYDDGKFKRRKVGDNRFDFTIHREPVDLLIKATYRSSDFHLSGNPYSSNYSLDLENDGKVLGIEPSDGTTFIQLRVDTEKVFGPASGFFCYTDVKLVCPIVFPTAAFTQDDIEFTDNVGQANNKAALLAHADLYGSAPPTRVYFNMNGPASLFVRASPGSFLLWELGGELIIGNEVCLAFGSLYRDDNCDEPQEPAGVCN